VGEDVREEERKEGRAERDKDWHYKIINFYIKFLRGGHGVNIIHLDYKKAFDTVPHKRLLKKIC